MNSTDKIFVAGHKGLVGSTILIKLLSMGFKNIITKTSKELDLRRQKEVEEFFEEQNPKYVFLCAAKVGGIIANNTYKADFIYDNIAIAVNTINSAYKYGVRKLLNLGTGCIYPKLAKQPIKEEYLLTGTLEPTNEPYAIAKISAIKLCRYYNEQYGTNYISIMPSNLYGRNDNFHLTNSHVLPALLRRFHLGRLLYENNFVKIRKDLSFWDKDNDYSKESDTEIKHLLEKYLIQKNSLAVWGSGKPFREFLHVKDMADACIFLMEKYDYKKTEEFINVGTGIDIKIADLANMIAETVSYKGEINYDLSKPDGTHKKLLDCTRIKELGWSHTIELSEGIIDTYDWYKSLY